MKSPNRFHPPSARRAGKGMLLLVVLLLAAGGGYFAWKSVPPAGRPPAAPVDFDAVDPEVADLVRTKVAEVEADSASGELHGSLGLAYEANAMWPEAARAFADAAALDPGEPLWQYHRARAMINSGDQEGGVALLVKMAPRVPNEAAVQLYLAHQLLDAGEFDQAQKAINNVVRLVPDRAEGHAAKGELFLAREEYQSAVGLLRRALDIDPNLSHAHYSLGLALRGLGELEEAEKELALGLNARRPGIADKFAAELSEYGVNYVGVINRSSDLIEAGEYQVAVESLERLKKTRPNDRTLLNNLGSAYMKMKKYDLAIEHLKLAREQDENFFGTHQNLAVCYRETGDLQKALFHADRAVRLGPDNSSTHLCMTRVLAQLGRFDDALRSIDESVRLDPEDATKHAAKGELLAALKRPLEAKECFQRAIDLSPSFLPPRLNLIRILIGTGDLERAEEVLRGGEEIAPDHERIQECRRLYQSALARRAAAQRGNG